MSAWRNWLPWPIGTHWCWFEAFTMRVFAVYLVVIASLLLSHFLLGWPR
jgi:hypothetical protein